MIRLTRAGCRNGDIYVDVYADGDVDEVADYFGRRRWLRLHGPVLNMERCPDCGERRRRCILADTLLSFVAHVFHLYRGGVTLVMASPCHSQFHRFYHLNYRWQILYNIYISFIHKFYGTTFLSSRFLFANL